MIQHLQYHLWEKIIEKYEISFIINRVHHLLVTQSEIHLHQENVQINHRLEDHLRQERLPLLHQEHNHRLDHHLRLEEGQ